MSNLLPPRLAARLAHALNRRRFYQTPADAPAHGAGSAIDLKACNESLRGAIIS
jgi:hypothetical protein